VGIEEAVETVKCLEMILTELILDGKVYKIISKMGIESQVYFGILDHQISYSFLTPWLALNEKIMSNIRSLGPGRKERNFWRIFSSVIFSLCLKALVIQFPSR